MAHVEALRGVRYNPEIVKLGGVLAPPYDVINEERRDHIKSDRKNHAGFSGSGRGGSRR